MHLYEKTILRDIIYEGKIFTVARDTVELEDGSEAFRELVLHTGGAGILPIDEDGNVTLVRQYRAGAGAVLTEICAGKLEKGEDPLDCALRELSEELGLEAQKVTPLGFLDPTPAYDSEKTYIFLAHNLKSVDRHPDKGEFMDIVKMPLEKALESVYDGTLTDAKTQLALLKAERLLYGKN